MKVNKAPPNKNLKLNLILIGLVISIVLAVPATLFIRDFLGGSEDPYSEIFFDSPDNLPDRIIPGKDYRFSYVVKSNYKEPANLTYYSTVSLYKIYDVIESRYACLSRYRPRTYMKWSNETSTDLLPEGKNIDAIPKLYMEPQNHMNWTDYTVDFTFSSDLGNGQLLMYVAEGDDVKYSIMLDEYNNRIMYGDEVMFEGNLSLRRQNNYVRIAAADNQVSFYINNDFYFSHEEEDYEGGIGLQSRDSFYRLFNLRAYTGNPYAVPDQGNVIEFNTFSNYQAEQIDMVKSKRSKKIALSTNFETWNKTIDCGEESFYCRYFDLPNDISFFLPYSNLTTVVERIPAKNINYVLSPRSETPSVDWEDFDISYRHERIRGGSEAVMVVKFSDKWAVMITRNNSYFLVPMEDYTKIDEIRNPLKENATTDQVYIHVNKQNIILKISNQTVFVKDTPEDYTHGSLKLYVKNEVLDIDPISITRNDPVCDDPYSFEFCSIRMEPSARTYNRYTQQEEEYRVDVLTQYQDSYSLLDFAENLTNRSFPIINVSVYNPYIPDRRIVLDQYPLINASNYSIQYDYFPIDGSYVYEIGLNDGGETLGMHLLARNDLVVVYINGETVKFNYYVNETQPGRLKMVYRNGNVTFYINHEPVYHGETQENNGNLFLGSRNTYLELANINYVIDGWGRRLPFDENSCELKLVYSETNERNSFLAPGESARHSEILNAVGDFDYGKISVVHEDLEIHFWVMRDD